MSSEEAPECVLSGLHLAHARLVRLEEQSVHVGQLHAVVVEQQQLGRQEERPSDQHTTHYTLNPTPRTAAAV